MKMAVIALLLVACLRAVPVGAADDFDACSNRAKTQLALDVCASNFDAKFETTLNLVYNKLLLAARANPITVRKIRNAERAWVAYRDDFVNATYPATDKQAAYGSIYPMEVDLLRAKLARCQISALTDLLGSYTRSR